MAFDEILQWSNKQEAEWMSDALRRLSCTPNHELADEEIAEIMVRVKHTNGILSDPAPVYVPLSKDDLPKDIESGERSLLCSIGQVQNIDRLAPDQSLTFALNGVTLIYGDNGSGKSGYSRIAKKLCRSLTVDPLQGNVFDEGEKKPGEVLVRHQPFGQLHPTETSWTDGQQPPEGIAAISVFDSKNARLYVDQENKIQYLPKEIELLEMYGRLCQKLSLEIDSETKEVRQRISIALPTGFTPGSAISALVAPLNNVPSQRKGVKQSPNEGNPLPDKEALILAATWNEKLATELKGLEESFRDSPSVLAAKYERIAAAITTLSNDIGVASTALTDAKASELEEALVKARSTADAATVAASEAFKDEPLPHTGSEAWKLMYKYAKEFAELAAGGPTSQISINELCVACQQTISPEAAARLNRFEDFISAKANTEAEAASQALASMVSALRSLKIPAKTQVESQLGELAALGTDHKAFVDKVAGYVEAIGKRRNSLIVAVGNSDFSELENTPLSITESIDCYIDSFEKGAKEFREKANESGDRAEDRKRLADLNDQKKLSESIETFTARLADLQLLEKLAGCSASLNTTGISTFITGLRKRLVTGDLQKRIEAEITTLDLGHIPFSIKDRSEGGKSFVGIKLKAVSDVNNRDILSEGEQRALALACFLGEITGDPVKHGIIIDDPVSSLDHIRIRRVAERLVNEAANGRQVIIFTHNVLFYSEVVYAAGQLNPQVAIKRHCIRKDESKGFGIVHDNDEPWIAKDVNKRIELMRNQHLVGLKNRTDTATDEYRRAVKDFYTDLRETWERFVEEVLLGGVVERFNNEVKTQSLKRVVVQDDDYQKIFYAMKRVSERSGHDTAAGRTIPTPSYDDMKKDLEELDGFRKLVKDRGKKTEDERRKLESPPSALVA